MEAIMRNFLLLFSLLCPVLYETEITSISNLQQAEVQWEQVAKKEAQKRYPFAQILFCHLIWKKENNNFILIQYKVFMRNGNRHSSAFVSIKYHENTNKIIDVQVIPALD
jgi:hypothetical protein